MVCVLIIAVCMLFFKLIFFTLLVRSIYFLGMPTGTYSGDVGIQIIFSDLPALLFMSAVVATGFSYFLGLTPLQDVRGTLYIFQLSN